MFTKKLLFIITILLSLTMSAQITTSTVSGKVLNNNLTVANANITLTHLPTNFKYKASSNKDGQFGLENLTVGGPYEITVYSDGFKIFKNSNINLSLGDNELQNILLVKEESVLSEVVIAGKKGVSKIGSSNNFSEKTINSLPNISRGITDVTKLTPQSANNSFAGTNFRYNNVTIDGSINNDAIGFSPSLGGQSGTSGMPGSSTRSNSISLDAIQDIQVYIAPYDVKLGNFLGGSVNAVTRSGTNKVTGSVYGFGRNASITGPNNAGDGSKIPSAFEDYQAGVRVGFPIVKDKLFFFTNFEIGRRVDPVFYNAGEQGSLIDATTAQSIANTVQTKYGFNVGSFDSYSIYAQSKKFFNKIDFKINDNHQLSIRNNTVISEASNLERDAVNFRFSSVDFIQKSFNSSTVLELKSHFGSQLSNNFTAGYSTVKDYREPVSGNILFPQVEIATNGGTVFLGNDREATVFNLKQNTTEITDNLTFKAGKHTLTLGTHNEFYNINYGFVNAINGRISFSSLANFNAGLPTRVRGTYAFDGSSRDDTYNNPYAKFNVNLYSVYFQDEIKIGDRIKITPGIRVDYADVPTKPLVSPKVSNAVTDVNIGNTYNYTPINQISNNIFGKALVSPRLGFSVDFFNNKSFIMRGGTGVFTGRIPFAWLGYAFYNDGVGYGSYDKNNLTPAQVAGFGGDPLATNGLNGYQDKSNPKIQVDLIDNDFKMPQISRNSLAFDVNVHGYKFTVEGIYTQVIRDLKFQQINIKDTPTYYTYDKDRQQPIYGGGATNSSFSNAYLLSNTGQGYRYSVTGQVSKNYDFGLNFMVAYTYGESKDITNGIRNSMESNYQLNQSLTPNDPKLANSNFDVRNRFVGNLGYQVAISKNNTLSANMYFNAQSGNPFTWGFVNSTLAKSGQAAGLAFIPKDLQQANTFFVNNTTTGESAAAQAANFMDFVESNDYLSSRKGNFTERNGDRTPWNIQADIRIQDEFRFKVNGSSHSIQLSLSVINVGNLINKDWGKSYFVPNTFNSTASLGLVAKGTAPVGASNAGDPVFNFVRPSTTPYVVDQFASRFQGQLGLRYSF